MNKFRKYTSVKLKKLCALCVEKTAALSILAVSSLVFSCGPEKPVVENTTTGESVRTNTVVEKTHVVPPDFNADSAFAYIKTQADMGPRVPGTRAHEKAVAYYEKHFKNLGADVKVLGGNTTTYDGKQWRIDNVIATFNPQAKTRILLAAHYDSRPFADKDPIPANRTKPCPGVNDGASGVGVLMEIARLLKEKPVEIGIDFILFDLEDYGDNGDPNSWCLGAVYWSNNMHKPGYKAKYAVLLDMVGAKDAVFPRERASVFHANDVVNKIWNAADKLGYGNYFVYEESTEMTDDHVPINKIANIPAVDILHYNYLKNEFFEHHHTISDDINTIDKKTLKAVGQTLMEVIYNEE